MIPIEHTSSERLKITIIASADPTGGNAEFNLTAATAQSPSGGWSNGSKRQGFQSWLYWVTTTGAPGTHAPTCGSSSRKRCKIFRPISLISMEF